VIKAALAMLLATGVIGSFVAIDSLAVFTDSKANAANTFTTGSVSLTDTPSSAVITLSGMAPGDQTIQGLAIANAGSLDLRYAMSTSATNVDGKGLMNQLQLTVRTKTANPCTSLDGAVLYGPGALASGAFGSNAQGAQAGDRTLTASSSETLCFDVSLPLATGNTFQGATTTATFTFDAEQTANNP
jgi:spore coat-associated protein N